MTLLRQTILQFRSNMTYTERRNNFIGEYNALVEKYGLTIASSLEIIEAPPKAPKAGAAKGADIPPEDTIAVE